MWTGQPANGTHRSGEKDHVEETQSWTLIREFTSIHILPTVQTSQGPEVNQENQRPTKETSSWLTWSQSCYSYNKFY